MAGLDEVTHAAPAWRDRSDFIVAAHLEETDRLRTEQIWAKRVGERRFEVCCIPFFRYDVALGDVVETDENYMIQRAVRRSGRFVFRVWFERPNQQGIASELESLGAMLEWASPHLLAVDAKDKRHAQVIAAYLEKQETSGSLRYETGRLNEDPTLE